MSQGEALGYQGSLLLTHLTLVTRLLSSFYSDSDSAGIEMAFSANIES